MDDINSYISLLNNKIVANDKFGFGWYRDLSREDRIGNVATAQSILVYALTNSNIPHKNEVFDSLLKNRLPDGSWAFISNINDVGVIDSTAWVLLALQSNVSPYYQNKNLLQTSFDWLISTQTESGGWGLIKDSSPRTISTSIAISALLAAKDDNFLPAIDKAKSYLERNQDSNEGYFWRNSTGNPCVSATSYAIFALYNLSPQKFSVEINRAANWLLAKHNQEFFWENLLNHEEVEVLINNKPVRTTFYYPITPLAIRAVRLSKFANEEDYHIFFTQYLTALKNHKVFNGTKTMDGKDTSYGVHDIVMSILEKPADSKKGGEAIKDALDQLKSSVEESDFPKVFQVHKSNRFNKNGINVVFFHGLDGHPIDTWLNESTQLYFPHALVNDDIPQINIYTVGYNNAFSYWLGEAMSLKNRTTNIIQLLENFDFEVGRFVFVGHSFGGLLIKSIIRDIHMNEPQSSPIYRILANTIGVCFVATPHFGSKWANRFKTINPLARTTQPINDLLANNKEVIALNTEYKNLAHNLNIKHISFSETKKTAILTVVNNESSDFGFPGSRNTPIDADHISIAKPMRTDSLIVESLKNFIKKLNQ
ncbi:hypothetical protein ACQE3E_09780 [Methylomonas sp. MED-D]|uniref:alpha/beta hydrolase n=1 Tax=unclassified Methylomonas TaxID=2608980 RepID=UPI0028A47CE7|nr:hypothetical protein [Methylomonas sp. MV1]MDT4328799.1 hypothetical protein [Methylomonas sp. MV1]